MKPAYIADDTHGLHLNEIGCAVAGNAAAKQIRECTTLAMDFNKDYKVDIHDFSVFAQNWLNVEYGESLVTLTNAPTYQTTPTYDGSGQAVHPDVVVFPDGWNGYKYWMVMTPYPFSNNQNENPSILASNDGYSWQVPPGLTNPIIGPPIPGYNADTDIVYNEDTNEIWIYFLRYWTDSELVKLTLMRSGDGVNWSEPEYLVTWDRQIEDNERSYAIIKQGLQWHYWAQSRDAPHSIYYRYSTDGRSWSEVQDVTFLPEPVLLPWHLDVIYVDPKVEYWMLFNDWSKGKLFLAKSVDGMNWELDTHEVLRPSDSGWDNTKIYRSTLLYDNESHLFRVWYSAHDDVYEWHIGYTEEEY